MTRVSVARRLRRTTYRLQQLFRAVIEVSFGRSFQTGRRPHQGLLLLAVVLGGSAGFASTARAAGQSGVLGTRRSGVVAVSEFSIPWLMSEDVRILEEEIDFLQLRLNSLAPYSTQAVEQAGYHSRPTGVDDEIQWVQVDLGRDYQLDSIALVPATVLLENTPVEGYGFPLRFRVQVARTPDFRDGSLIADFSAANVPNPGRFPIEIPGIGQSGRYVRITVTRCSSVGGRHFFALGELIVLSGMRNVAAWRPVRTSGADYSVEGRWSREYLVDQNSALPLPIGPLASHTEGFVSQQQRGQTPKWIQLDLGKAVPIDEIRLVPARPSGQTDLPGWGFPERFRIEVANEADLSDAEVFCDLTHVDLHHWTDRSMILPGELREAMSAPNARRLWNESPRGFPSEPLTARYIRLTAVGLDGRIVPPRLALSEFQVYSDNSNVSTEPDVVVTASDEDRSFDPRRWSPRYLVDDFTSRTRLLEFPIWLGQLAERRSLQQDLDFNLMQHAAAVRQVWINLGIAGSVFVVLSITALTWRNWRLEKEHRLDTENLRSQIANDLHDDIGSNLGAIALLCQTTGNSTGLPPELKPELDEIRTVALETSDAMRDILWLIRTPTSRLDDFVGRLRTVITRLLSHCDTTFTCRSRVPPVDVPLSWRRNLFLSYKEVLHNAARHSKATQVNVQVEFLEQQIRIVVRDNGQGFDFDSRRDGLGINSIHKRMAQLGGSVEFESAVNTGTSVTLCVPLPGTRYRWRRLRRYAHRLTLRRE
jgi:signal transduction histidine kinase